MPKHPAIFLDRDGTIIEDNGYLKDISELNIYPYSFEALELLQNQYLLFIITNQSGISRGLITEQEVQNLNNHLVDSLKEKAINISEVFCCPHTSDDNCECKKPSPYYLKQAEAKYDLDLSKSFIIGDHPSDVFCGINAGVSPIYLLSGHGEKHLDELTIDVPTYNNLLDAAKSIILKPE